MNEIERLVASHCELSHEQGTSSGNGRTARQQASWQHDDLQCVVLVHINGPKAGASVPSKVAFRVPSPYKIGKEEFPNNAKEKLQAEAATYIWIHEHC
ncbi:hypothetical protein GX51_04820 [Blastomyces parvus]|uniref:Uncharacterized protein n=1 Tax=Blastomyces parvus TaxID=2060905 RepID=A0A2B7WZX7_9EURO|nr:hypothetical protein GX51_04820 [Blastomyces parvus]